MGAIRAAERRDVSRIAEILVFTKRMNYRSIFHNDEFSFGVLQVLPVAEELLSGPDALKGYFVYDDGFVKGVIHIEGDEIREFYVEPAFEGQGIGGELIEFAIREQGARWLSVLEKNAGAIRFYRRHGFVPTGERPPEEGTPVYCIIMARPEA